MTASSTRPTPRPIAKLPEAVVNRIAAGEIIQRPSNALKELIENSLDAGSTSIKVSVREGGVKLLQIQDNGSGIRTEDLPILCERFTTSKIKDFDDLSSLGTYGFRGEALASISHVAHLSITTKTKADSCAWKAAYSDGKMIPVKSGSSDNSPVPTAGNDGTTLVVEDLFFNTPQRLKSLRSASDEYNRIVAVVSAYSIHNAGVAMSCRRQGTNNNDIHINTTVGATVLDNIGSAYGEAVKKQLVEIETKDSALGMKCKAWCSGLNYQAKKGTYLFFINHRYVDCNGLKRALEAFYGSLLPKGSYPFVYLSLEISPNKIDVNVHPTKKEVGFEDQDEIVEIVCEALAKALENQGESRSYKVQTLLPRAGSSNVQPTSSNSASQKPSTSTSSSTPSTSSTSRSKPPKIAPQKLVRTDANSQTLDSMFPILSNSASTMSQSRKGKERAVDIDIDGDDDEGIENRGGGEGGGGGGGGGIDRPTKRTKSDHDPAFAKVAAEEQARRMQQARVRISQSDCQLTSVKNLRNRIIEERDEGLDQLFKNHIFVGVADVETGLSLVQHQTKLYLIRHFIVAEQLFYQLTLRQFGRFSRIKLKPPPSLKSLIKLAVEREYDSQKVKLTAEEIIQRVYSRIFDAREMLDEYFSFKINDEGGIESLPLILPGHAPDLTKLPLFLLRIGVQVDWESEQTCFDTFSQELAYFYIPEPNPISSFPPRRTTPEDENFDSNEAEKIRKEKKEGEEEKKRTIKNVLFPAFQRYLVPSKILLKHKTAISDSREDGGEGGDTSDEESAVILVTKLESLYKVFERC